MGRGICRFAYRILTSAVAPSAPRLSSAPQCSVRTFRCAKSRSPTPRSRLRGDPGACVRIYLCDSLRMASILPYVLIVFLAGTNRGAKQGLYHIFLRVRVPDKSRPRDVSLLYHYPHPFSFMVVAQRVVNFISSNQTPAHTAAPYRFP